MKRTRAYFLGSMLSAGLLGCEAMNSGAPAINPQMTTAAAAQGESVETLATGRRHLATRCASCHSLEPIAKYTPAQWKTNVARMADRAGLREDEAQKVIAYLVAARESL